MQDLQDYTDASSHLFVISHSCLFYSVPDVIPVAIPFILLYVAVVTSLISPVAAQTLADCLIQVTSGQWGSAGVTDDNGNPSSNVANATAVTYQLCLKICGSGPSPFAWSSFSQKFNSWLLPWVALVSQLPFGAKSRPENFLSAILAIGSPMLAAYSLALTVLNEQWVVRRFSGFQHRNRDHAIRVLIRLQQVSIRVVQEDDLLVVLPENDAWWKKLSNSLGYNYTWSIASVTAIFWVIIAYVFTLINSFQNIANALELDGQGIGLIWLWLLPVVICWLHISPKCDHSRVSRAITDANGMADVSTPGGTPEVKGRYAISLRDDYSETIYRAQDCSPPIFNHARIFCWTALVENVRFAFYNAAMKAGTRIPVNTSTDNCGDVLDPGSRSGSSDQVEANYQSDKNPRSTQWGPDLLSRIFVSSLIGLVLQWSTVGGAVVVLFYTPTIGAQLLVSRIPRFQLKL
jgi:hypothetical protein